MKNGIDYGGNIAKMGRTDEYHSIGNLSKVYVYVLGGQIYAWTLTAGIKELFEKQRNINKFKKLTYDVDEDSDDLSVFIYINKEKQLVNEILYDGKSDFEIAATYAEINQMTDKFNDVLNNLDCLILYLKRLISGGVDKPYLKEILEITDEIRDKDKDTFHIFYELFKETF